MTQHIFEKKSQLFELLECHFVLENTLRAWLIDMNTNPHKMNTEDSLPQNHEEEEESTGNFKHLYDYFTFSRLGKSYVCIFKINNEKSDSVHKQNIRADTSRIE